jgi:hypothetical protein
LPGSIVDNVVDPSTPLTYWLPSDLNVYSDGSPAFAVQGGAQGVTAPAHYPASNVLRSGWLLGENVVANHSTVVDAKVGTGDVVLLGLSVQHRAEAHGTYKLRSTRCTSPATSKGLPIRRPAFNEPSSRRRRAGPAR